jgi:hypothetical protein
MNKPLTCFLTFILFCSITEAAENADIFEVKHQKRVFTESGEAIIYYPDGLNVDEELFAHITSEDIPYIFEDLSINLCNEGNIEESNLNTIASIWCGNKNLNFITELEDYSPGVVAMIRSIKTHQDLNSVKRYLGSNCHSSFLPKDVREDSIELNHGRLREELKENWWDPREPKRFINKELEDFFQQYKPLSYPEGKKICKANECYRIAELMREHHDKTYIESDSLEKAAKIGHPAAQYELAMRNIMTDVEKARVLIYKSAAQCYPKALYKLSTAYLVAPELFNIRQDLHLAKLLCQELADNGDQQAECDIASAFLFETYGERRPKDEAIQMIKDLAERKDNPFAKDLLQEIDHEDSHES